MATAFKARFNRRDDGGYDANYGKGGKKITACILKGEDGDWAVASGAFSDGRITPHAKLGMVKVAWEEAAVAAYSGTPTPPPVPPRLGPPKLGGGPPKLAVKPAIAAPVLPLGVVVASEGLDHYEPLADAGAATCPTCNSPMVGYRKDKYGRFHPPCQCGQREQPDYEPDWHDPIFHVRRGDDRMPSDLGMLDNVYGWMVRNPEYVMTDGKLDSPWAAVASRLWVATGRNEYHPSRWNHSYGNESIGFVNVSPPVDPGCGTCGNTHGDACTCGADQP